jgi:hypothetical protein
MALLGFIAHLWSAPALTQDPFDGDARTYPENPTSLQALSQVI